jgi:hypothetical protein
MNSLFRLALPGALALALALPMPATATDRPADESIFVAGARYDAVLHRLDNRWRLLPATGADVKLKVAAGCGAGEAPPRGLWLLTRDAAGPVLVAPSATPLPDGHPGRVQLLGCGEASTGDHPALHLPRPLLDWLAEHSGPIHVTD